MAVSSLSFEAIRGLAQEKAIKAIHQGNPVAAREWLEVAATADAVLRGVYPPSRQTEQADAEPEEGAA